MAKAKKKAKKRRKAKKAKKSMPLRTANRERSRRRARQECTNVSFDSAPRAGMTMKLRREKLSPLPQARCLPRGTHVLEWTFAGPSGAEYQVLIAGAKSPTEPISDKIREGHNSASGYVDVLV